ncbi:hypothetical protein [Nocardioides antri]|uniref:Uncharacterized protein n=1 Tax=Nocardioides antri TaxID=2607659 RepID=A0A5B1M2D7_9ACTN|nr:hypothetical protein [Nocardioides antri]KAA1425920.1 hypothetical protein F0U47_16395 [Nocardioides antri]
MDPFLYDSALDRGSMLTDAVVRVLDARGVQGAGGEQSRALGWNLRRRHHPLATSFLAGKDVACGHAR